MIEDLPDSRIEKAEEVELEDAIEELTDRARRVTIRCVPQVVRLLLEVDRLQREVKALRSPGASREPLPGTWRVVEPNQRNPTAEHVQAPRDDFTMCGFEPDGWRHVTEISSENLDELLDRDGLCGRCVRSLRARYFGGSG